MKNDEIVVKILDNAVQNLSAYEILEHFNQIKKAQPMTVYRSLRHLLAKGKIHKSHQNRKYFICNQPDKKYHNPSIIVCQKCGESEELQTDLSQSINTKIKSKFFDLSSCEIQISSLCYRCHH